MSFIRSDWASMSSRWFSNNLGEGGVMVMVVVVVMVIVLMMLIPPAVLSRALLG